uniref:beta-N-acetylhexosaminidase n=1 Tax=Anisakis simplex TaxID=6269 RepID=A0A0M3JZT3_ANISI
LQKIVHFDLKGAPPKLEYYAELFPMLKRLNVDGVLMEYEDMFPYSGDIAILKRSIAYTRDQIASILSMAKQNDLEVIPLVQTFGHMEFALKYNRFAYLREDQEQIDTICPSESGSWILITEMLRQVRALHPESKRIHIGSDEAWQIAKDQRCLDRLRSELGSSTERLKLSHISRTANFAKHELGFDEVLAWNDMFGETNEQLLLQYKLGELLTPVVWGYSVNVTQPNYFPGGMFERYSKVFDRLMFASAFKGANGKDQKFANADRYLANQLSYVDLYRINETHLIGRLKGIILTGWQRYSHTLPLCEILPVGIPSLVMDIVYLNNTTVAVDELRRLTREFLDCRSPEPEFAPIMLGTESYYPPSDIAYTNCTFPGHQIYDIVIISYYLTNIYVH